MPSKTKSCQEFSFKNLHKAYIDCRRHKGNTYHAMKFHINCELELLKLEQELQTRTYKPTKSICFVVTHPTLREVFAANFRDRIVHHLLYNFLEPVFEPKFIHHSYACRKNKGIHRSLEDLCKFLKKVTKNRRQKAYFLHLDISGFFMSLKKEILFDIISREVKNPEIFNLVKIIIFHNPTDNFTAKSGKELFDQIPPHKSLFHVPKNQGLPIGNLTSQFFANVYLNELDQFVKHKLKVKFYLRYVDDFLLLSNDINELKKWQKEIDVFLKERLGLELNHKKQVLEDVETGIDWLGYVIKPGYILARKRVVKNFKQKLCFFNQELQKYPDTKQQGQLTLPFPENYPSLETIEEMLATINSYFGHFQHADTFHLRKNLLETKFRRLNDYIEPKNPDLISFRIKADFKKRCKENKKFL